MIIIVIIDLLVLCYYKYSYFFLDALYEFTGIELHVYNFFAAASNKMFGTNSLVDTIILPVGISFFTFQAMSYCIDIYRGKIKAVTNISCVPTSSSRSSTRSSSCPAAPSASRYSGF